MIQAAIASHIRSLGYEVYNHKVVLFGGGAIAYLDMAIDGMVLVLDITYRDDETAARDGRDAQLTLADPVRQDNVGLEEHHG